MNIATTILRSPFVLTAIVLEEAALAMRSIASMIRVAGLPSFLKQAKPKCIAPLGYWRCTYSRGNMNESFVPGGIYKAINLPEGSSSVRVIPTNHDFWSPYWDRISGTFFYEPDDLQFEYVGAKLPAGEVCLSSGNDV